MRILLAGTARCGSTWAANVLGHAADTRAVYEPDGPFSDVLGAMVATRLGEFPVLTADEPSRWYSLVWDLAFAGGWPWDKIQAARAAGRRMVRTPPAIRDYAIDVLAAMTRRVQRHPRNVIVKSVNSAFALDWIAQRYHPKIVVLRRNPLNVVSSWVVLQMGAESFIGHDPRVQEEFLRPVGITAPNGHTSTVGLTAYNVGLLTRALKQAAERHPDWIVVSHDELCLAPEAQFKDLTARLGLQWTTAMEDYLRKSDDPGFTVHGGSPKVHPNAVTATTESSRREQQATQFKRRLNPEQADEARRVLESFDLGDWGPPPA
jgi:hypothetical protein